MTASYTRSPLLNWYELTEAQQKQVKIEYDIETPEDEMYAIHQREAIPLSMFLRTTNNNFTHGVYGTSYFSGYFITLSECNTEAVVAYKHF